MKPRILMCNEASFLSTGYATYGREVLKRLYASGRYEIAEFASYAKKTDVRLNTIPWRVYCNLPDTEEEQQAFNSQPINQFGAWRFEQVCLDFKPHCVFNILDWWMMSFQEESPFKKCFKWAIMPTVDSVPQHEQWLATYANADAVFTYQDWSYKVLEKQGGGNINLLGTASPAADDCYFPVENKDEIKQQLGIGNYKVIGTIMRNQRRKLFPDLFQAFRKFLDQSKKKDVLLYCHTSYPDNGWDIPKILLDNGIASKVLFTYKCKSCQSAYPAFFSDAVSICIQCGQPTASPCNVQDGVSPEIMSKIINIFDLYVQPANSEGLGMPQLEAAMCGVPIMSTNFSAMEDVVKKLKGYPIPVVGYQWEVETGCKRALPDIDWMANKFEEFFDMPKAMQLAKGKQTRNLAEKYSSWDQTAETWASFFNTIDTTQAEQLWKLPPDIAQPHADIDSSRMSNREYVRFLITKVLCDTSKLGSYLELRMTRDLNCQQTEIGRTNLSYMNDDSMMAIKSDFIPFTRENAYNAMVNSRDKINQWEQARHASNA